MLLLLVNNNKKKQTWGVCRTWSRKEITSKSKRTNATKNGQNGHQLSSIENNKCSVIVVEVDFRVWCVCVCVGVAWCVLQASKQTNEFDENWRLVLRRSWIWNQFDFSKVSLFMCISICVYLYLHICVCVLIFMMSCVVSRRPGQLSPELRAALGIGPDDPPPWLFIMQRVGPPPSYPNLKIPGLNAPIPHGKQFGFNPGQWGKVRQRSIDVFCIDRALRFVCLFVCCL